MLNYIVGTLVAAIVLGSAWAGLEYNVGRNVLDPSTVGRKGQEISRPLADAEFGEVIKLASNRFSKQRIDAIIELGYRDDDLEKQVEILGLTVGVGSPGEIQAAVIGLLELGDKAVPQVKKYFDFDAGPDYDEGTRRNQVIGCSLVRAIGQPCDQYFPKIKQLLYADDGRSIRYGLYALRGLPHRAKECEPRLAELMLKLPEMDDFNFNNQVAICRITLACDLRSAAMEQAFQKMLTAGLPSVKAWSGECLGEFVDSPTDSDNARLLAGAIEKAHILVAHQLLIGLAKQGPKAAPFRDIVVEKTKHHDRYVSAAASLALTCIDDDEKALKACVQKLVNSPQSEQLGVDMAMKLGDRAIVFLDDLLLLTEHRDAIIRETATIAIGDLGPAASSAIAKLKSLTGDSDPIVRYAASEAIQKIMPQEVENGNTEN